MVDLLVVVRVHLKAVELVDYLAERMDTMMVEKMVLSSAYEMVDERVHKKEYLSVDKWVDAMDKQMAGWLVDMMDFFEGIEEGWTLG